MLTANGSKIKNSVLPNKKMGLFLSEWANTAQKMKFSTKDFFSKCD